MGDASSHILDGIIDVRVIFSYFENVAMREINKDEKPFELLAFLDGPAFQFYYDRFTRDGMVTEEGIKFNIVRTSFIEEFEEKEEAHKVLRKDMVATLDPTSLIGS